MNRKTRQSGAHAADQPVFARPGEQVYAGEVDDILAGRIVERTRENAHASSRSASRSQSSGKKKPPPGKPGGLKRTLALAAVIAAIAALIIRALSSRGARGRRKR